MLASSLIRSFVSTPTYMRAYCDAYGGDPATLPAAGAPPTRGHAENMARTLVEWAGRLDAAGVQVHQEGALARFSSAIAADDYGRPAPAAAARRKTAAFYADVIARAVAMRSAASFTIPAAPYQGAVVATHEAAAAAAEFHAAERAVRDFSADPSRPELIAEAEKLRGTLGRAASMHATACAEAVAAWRACGGGPWFRQVTDRPLEAISMPSGQFTVGVEIWAGHPAISGCHAMLDPQHGGGVYGFGRQPAAGCVAACDAALSLREQGLVLPESTRYVTARTDPDSLVAAMILSGRIPLALVSRDRIRRLAERDAALPREGGWRPEFRAHTVGDDSIWGPLGLLMIPRRGEAPTPLDELEAAALSIAIDAAPTALLRAARELHAADMERARTITAPAFSVDGPVAFASDLPVGGGAWAACYSRAPIGVLSFVRPGTDARAYTVAACGDLGPTAAQFIAAFHREIGEPGWAGAGGITGSRAPTKKALPDVVAAARRAAATVGIDEDLSGYMRRLEDGPRLR